MTVRDGSADRTATRPWAGARRGALLLLGTLGALPMGCSTPIGACPAGSEVEQSQGKSVLTARCNSCHTFAADPLTSARARTLYGKAHDGSMPPAGPLSPEELEQLRIYLACNAAEK